MRNLNTTPRPASNSLFSTFRDRVENFVDKQIDLFVSELHEDRTDRSKRPCPYCGTMNLPTHRNHYFCSNPVKGEPSICRELFWRQLRFVKHLRPYRVRKGKIIVLKQRVNGHAKPQKTRYVAAHA